MRDDLTFLSIADVLVEVGKANNPGSHSIAILCQTLNMTFSFEKNSDTNVTDHCASFPCRIYQY